MSRVARALLDGLAVGLTHTLFRLDAQGLEKIPPEGPLILVSNHITALELPVLRVLLRPRTVHTLAKAESWDRSLLGWMLDQWHAIPVRRGESDLKALRASLQVLKHGGLLGIMPEGTRSGDGLLQTAHPGIAVIAQRAGCPILPLALWGVENVLDSLKRWKRCDFHLRVGEPFMLNLPEGRQSRDIRQRQADEVMRHVAALMPEVYHGVYRVSKA